ncbi:MAG TPA: hypothetical protein VJY12_09790 [Dysgonamonadaceae bacterium]|jgi:hypothetical protein|nr:hypothetical protein [Dysgonamonadaceae bacterium]
MKKNNKQLDSDELWIKSMMEQTKKEPSENLSYRIMHQIETERVLAGNKKQLSKDKGDVLIDLRNIFGLMYLVLLITGISFYLQGGKEALFTETFLWTCVTISSVFSIFFLISTADNLLRKRKTKF